MPFLTNINSVARYESKILKRSWFFKVFTVLALLYFFFYGIIIAKYPDWRMVGIASNFPYDTIRMFNMVQGIIVIFLSSEFLKRDKKLDTSEVFYVRPLSNAEYMLGKVWGNLKLFFMLNFVILAMVMIFNFVAEGATVDFGAYLSYFLLISVPSLIYMLGLSIFLMLLLGNQALTFILLLGYIGLEMFYINDKLFFAFDFLAMSLPLQKSSITGFSNLGFILVQRGIYLSLGMGLIFFSISQFRRLPNSRLSTLPWILLSVVMFSLSGVLAYKHLDRYYSDIKKREQYVEINNKYLRTPRMEVVNYTIDLEQQPNKFSAKATIEAVAADSSNIFAFTLNPYLKIDSVSGAQSFEREQQIVIVKFEKTIAKGDTTKFAINYHGTIDESFCYLDIPQETIAQRFKENSYSIDKRYAFITPQFLLLTPETYWYPRAGVAYSSKSVDWQQTFFSKFSINIKPLSGLIPVSSGESTYDSVARRYTFAPEYPMKSAFVAIGQYEKRSIKVDSVEYSAIYIKGHNNFTNAFDSVGDTLASMIRIRMDEYEQKFRFNYPFRRLSLVEVPVQFLSYPRSWSEAQEVAQPEVILFPERGYSFWFFNFKHRVREDKEQRKQEGKEISDLEAQMNVLTNVFRIFRDAESAGGFRGSMNGGPQLEKPKPNPYYIFPQFYNFRYNVYSPRWSVANRVIEVYVQNRTSQGGTGWRRNITGISDEERVNLLSNKQSFVSIFNNPDYRDLTNTLVGANANRIFAPAELNLGIDRFRDTLVTVLKNSTFKNLRFETFIDTLSKISSAEIAPLIEDWERPIKLPRYVLEQPSIRFITSRGEELYQIEFAVSNVSEVDGIVKVEFTGIRSQGGDNATSNPTKWMMKLEPHQTKSVVSHFDESPRDLNINTMISGNIPSRLDNGLNNVQRGGRRWLKDVGIFSSNDDLINIPGEIVVDNEDSTRFSLSTTAYSGYLTRWLGPKPDTSYRYSGVQDWRPPYKWTATTNAKFYGKTIRSAYTIRSGSGEQYALWRVPVPESGRYELYYYVTKPEELDKKNMRNNNSPSRKRGDAEYLFEIGYDNQSEDAYIDLRNSDDGWVAIGIYQFDKGEMTVKLKDKTGLRSVTADAVKLVRR